jgi:thioredoxin-dependent peroxiredoxin
MFSKILATLLFITPMGTSMHAALKIEDIAPELSIPDETGKIRTIREFKGKKVVLYFFPKSNTPHCTDQACSFRGNFNKFSKNNIVVIGISYDSVDVLKKFKEEHHLQFILLSDSKKEVATKYGAYRWWMPFFPKRITFIIDEQGNIQSIMNDVDAAANADQILTTLGIK